MKPKITYQLKNTQVFFVLLVFHFGLSAQTVDVDVNLNVMHKVGDIETFEREKFVTIHADVTEPEWTTSFGPNFTPDLRDHFLNGYDVYLGRNTGDFQQKINRATQDPLRAGYPNISIIETVGQSARNSYGAKTELHAYESRSNLVLAAQLHPFWPDGRKLSVANWALSQEDTPERPFGTASGEFMAHYIKNNFGTGSTDGQPRPQLVEVINEPIWHLVEQDKVNNPIDIFKFHKTVANEVKAVNPEVQIGGYCTAFPDFERRNFDQWNERWKLFMDEAGADMDFWAIHLYDFPSINNGQKLYRKGSNMEATMDMMNHYSYLSFGEAKDIMVSEYGAQMHDYFGAWSPYRDWLHIASSNSMMMQFMERADNINAAINFLIIKATWGTSSVNSTYNHRLLRRADEPVALTGEWVYTDMVKLYELWSDVNGTRVDTWSSDLDIMVDAYVDNNKAYIMLNNLEFEDKTINLDLFEDDGVAISSLNVKHLYLDDAKPKFYDNSPVLNEQDFTVGNIPDEYVLKPEGTMILEYTYASAIDIDHMSSESKYYATEYLKPIKAGVPLAFDINGIVTAAQGEVTLRLGIGRDHGKSLRPVVTVNGTNVYVRHDFRGDDQRQKGRFFGVIEIDVPYDLLEEDNTVNLEFNDDGGHVSSVVMQVYNFSEEISRTSAGSVTGVTLNEESVGVAQGGGKQLKETITPFNATNPSVTWFSSDTTVAKVDASGFVTGVSVGTTNVTVTTVDGSFTDVATVSVENTPSSFDVDNRSKYKTTNYFSGGEMKVTVNYEAGTGNVIDGQGVRVLLREIVGGDWSAVPKDYIGVDLSAAGKQSGTSVITIDLKDVPASEDLSQGGFYFLFPVAGHTGGGASLTISDNDLFPITILRDSSIVDLGVNLVELQQEEIFIKTSETSQLTVSVLPTEAANKAVTWSSEDESVATVSGDGLVTGVAEGMTRITVTTVDGGKTDELTVVVSDFVLNVAGPLPGSNITLYPNPSGIGVINVDGLSGGKMTIDLYDLSGILLRSSKVTGSVQYQIDVSEIYSGVYILKILDDGADYNLKIILQ